MDEQLFFKRMEEYYLFLRDLLSLPSNQVEETVYEFAKQQQAKCEGLSAQLQERNGLGWYARRWHVYGGPGT